MRTPQAPVHSPTRPTTGSPVDRLATLTSALVSDALDGLGWRSQNMAPGLRRLAGPGRIVGTAATLNVIAVDEIPRAPYRVQFEAIDGLESGQILVVAGPDVASAFWGELITSRAHNRGCVGVVVDGFCRDIQQIRDREDFGVWARGTHPADSLGRLDATEWNTRIVCQGVEVRPGDYLVCDDDGVVVVPVELIDDVLLGAETKQRAEDAVRRELGSGKTIGETFDRHGVM